MPQEGSPFRFTSPALAAEMLYECPTGYLLREAPHVFDVIEATGSLENASPPDLRQCSTYLQHAGRIVRAERARLRELREIRERQSNDSAYGMQARG